MKLFAICPKCKQEIDFKSKLKTRAEFALKEGETKSLICESCETENSFKVDELTAKKSNIALIVAGLLFLIGIPFVIYYLSHFVLKIGGLYATLTIVGFLLIPVIVYKMIQTNEKIRVNRFNFSKLKD